MSESTGSVQERIIAAALELLERGGHDAVSTRSVSAAAGVQPPTIYRFFGDKQGLLDAMAASGFEKYLATKTKVAPSGDPVADLRRGWDMHVELGLANPALYTLMYGQHRPDFHGSPAHDAAIEVLAVHIKRIAEAGRLRVPEALAVSLVHAAGSGTTLALIVTPERRREPALSTTAREAVISAITTDPPVDRKSGPVAAAVALRSVLPEVPGFSAGERVLLDEWLARIR